MIEQNQPKSERYLGRLFFSASLKVELEKEGKIIDDADLFIASCSLTKDLILVTNNEKHFRRFESLKIENWKE